MRKLVKESFVLVTCCPLFYVFIYFCLCVSEAAACLSAYNEHVLGEAHASLVIHAEDGPVRSNIDSQHEDHSIKTQHRPKILMCVCVY